MNLGDILSEILGQKFPFFGLLVKVSTKNGNFA
jgi:hypothetical protein